MALWVHIEGFQQLEESSQVGGRQIVDPKRLNYFARLIFSDNPKRTASFKPRTVRPEVG
ncbi:hypothetical protein [Mesorhizobium sp. M0203]|uniref:hypothetical protein n=1 Tax=Mesorhizobium sp. M0203 TaxID=2956912 RepID=UPI00333B59A1